MTPSFDPPPIPVFNRRVNNFTSDIKDSEAYLHLLNQIADREAGVTMEGLHVSASSGRVSVAARGLRNSREGSLGAGIGEGAFGNGVSECWNAPAVWRTRWEVVGATYKGADSAR